MKNVFKKTTLTFFVVIFLFLLSGFVSIKHWSTASIYDKLPSWQSHELGIKSLKEQSIDSQYRPFSQIINQVSLIDITKTYVIESAYDLYMFSEMTLGFDKTLYLSLDYVLGNNIDYYDVVLISISYRFNPIGFSEPFTGTFDGQGFEISNLYFQTILDEQTYNQNYFNLKYFSMFSMVSETGIIKNLGLINPIMIQPIDWGVMQYASPLVGENRGLVEHVYVIDQRREAAGFHVEGDMQLSGLISTNYGTVVDAFISTPRVRALGIFNLTATHALMAENYGFIDHLYYDETILVDRHASINLGTGLQTPQFQEDVYFSDQWFFNDSYHLMTDDLSLKTQFSVFNTYPILRGLKTSNQIFLLYNALDILYMNELLIISGAFRMSHYQVINDIDMNQIASDAYVGSNVAFSGILSGKPLLLSGQLFDRDQTTGGDIIYPAIIDLSIYEASTLGNYASYGFFASLFGTVKNINFINFLIETDDLEEHQDRTMILIGSIAGQTNRATIDNVHVNQTTHIKEHLVASTKYYVGGFVGQESGVIKNSSVTGDIIHQTQIYKASGNYGATGGIIGHSIDIGLDSIYSDINIIGIGYVLANNATHYMGGIIGTGSIDYGHKLVFLGEMNTHPNQSYIHQVYVGGIFGFISDQIKQVDRLHYQGTIHLNLNHQMISNVSGIANIDGSLSRLNAIFSYEQITNTGVIEIIEDTTVIYDTPLLSSIETNISGLFILTSVDITFKGLFNYAAFVGNLSVIDHYAGLIYAKNDVTGQVIQGYNLGDVSLSTNQIITQSLIKISQGIIGGSLDLYHLRNEGDVGLYLLHGSSLLSGNLVVVGLFDEIKDDHVFHHGFNGGNIVVEKSTGDAIYHNVYVSGIGYKHSNIKNLIDQEYSYEGIHDFTKYEGSLNQVLNSGDLTILGSFFGHVRASGVLIYNLGLMTNVTNLGEVNLEIDIKTNNSEIASSGIVYANIGAYAWLKDIVNSGDITAISLSSFGFAHASGVVLRNDILENNTFVAQGSLHRHQKITFSVNNGNIYAWSHDQSLITIDLESKTKAAGILTMGMSSIVNVINYGDIYSKYVAGGILGFLYLNRFGAVTTYPSIYFGSLINYGRIREIKGYDQTFNIQTNEYPNRTEQNAFGAIFGKFHTNAPSLLNTNYTAGWTFLSIETTDYKYPLDAFDFKNIYNFDPVSDVLGNASGLTLSQQMISSGTGNTIVLDMISHFNTLKTNDRSKAPLNQFAMQTQSKTTLYGRKITNYELNDTSSGIFYTELTYGISGSEQLTRNYISKLKRVDIAPHLLSLLESKYVSNYFGIYALSSSKGIKENIFLPNHMDIDNMHPLYNDGVIDQVWLGNPLDETSISFKLYTKSLQKTDEPQAYVFDLEIIQTDEFGNPISNGLALSKPEIDEDRGLITYYIPTNYQFLSGQTSIFQSTYGYYETSLGVNQGRKVPYVNDGGSWDYKVVGRYKKELNQTFTEIGPYHSDGLHQMNFVYESTPKDSINLLIEDAIYFQKNLTADGSLIPYLYQHSPHFYFKVGTNNESWINEAGYRIDRTSIVTDLRGGFYPYKLVSNIVGPPNYEGVYYYVGPNEEPVTYDYITTSNHQIYNDLGLYFGVNINSSHNVLYSGATLNYQGTSDSSLITIPKAYGAYDTLYDQSNHQIIDRIEDHYGHVRIYSSQYDPNQNHTFRDYQIRIIRTSDQSLSSIKSLTINGNNALPTVYNDFQHIIATENIHYKKEGALGSLEVIYQTSNFSENQSILDYIQLKKYDPVNLDYLTEVDQNLYMLSQGLVVGDQIFNQSTGDFGSAEVTITMDVTDYLPSGLYRLEITLPTGEVYQIDFEKDQSYESEVLELTYQNKVIYPTTQPHLSYIPYGIFYQESDGFTNQVNFANLDLIQYIDSIEVVSLFPSYLEGMRISPFSTIESVTLDIFKTLDDRYVYELTYQLAAENGNLSTFIHRLEEYVIYPAPKVVYKNGSVVESLENIQISYTEAPTLRVEYHLENLYITDLNLMKTESTMIPFGNDEAVINEDYYVTSYLKIGYEVNFNRHIPLGTYKFHTSFKQDLYLWGEILSWDFVFDAIEMEKIQNNNSLISDILFISDTIYSGFNTIVDYEVITESSYVSYMQFPTTRRINVLPTKGIYYGNYAENSTYWIVGQVQETNLIYFQPVFTLPEGAIIRRVTDLINVAPSYQSEILNDDFSPFGDTFNFILYRVYAHDYDETLKPLNYTNYYVAVQDITNNIKLNLSIENQTTDLILSLFTRVTVYQSISHYGVSNHMIEMSSHASYNIDLNLYENHAFQTSMSGYYLIDVFLPKGYTYYITVNDQIVSGHAVTLETAILPKRYFVKIIIIESTESLPWGEHITYIFDGKETLLP